MVSDLNMSLGKMSDFVSFPMCAFTLVMKLRNLILKVTEILQYFLIKNDVRFDYALSSSVSFGLSFNV